MTTALIIVDLQRDFCEGGALPVPGSMEVIHNINQALIGDTPWDLIVATKDWHIDPKDHFDDWPPHCVVGTEGTRFPEAFDLSRALESKPMDVFYKGLHSAAYSGFEGINSDGLKLDDYLKRHEVTEVDIAGLATDHCVKATAIDATFLGYRTSVWMDLVAGVSDGTVASAIEEMRQSGVILANDFLNAS